MIIVTYERLRDTMVLSKRLGSDAGVNHAQAYVRSARPRTGVEI
jgi:hypothetical protein